MASSNNNIYDNYYSNGITRAIRLSQENYKTYKRYADIAKLNQPAIDAINRLQKPLRDIQKQIASIQNMSRYAKTDSERINNNITQSYMNYFVQVADPDTQKEIQAMGDAIETIAPLGWSYSKKYSRNVYLLAFRMLDEVGHEEKELALNDFFVEAVEEYVLPTVRKEDFQQGLGKDWDATIDYVIEQVHQKNMIGAIPLLLICTERVFARIDGSENEVKNPGPTRNGFEKKTHDKNILSFLTYRNNGILMADLVRYQIFGSENHEGQNILNRNKVSHGKSNPVGWGVKDMYQLLTVFLSLCEVAEEYYYYLERGGDNE